MQKNHPKNSDRYLIDRCVSADREAAGEFVREFSSMIYGSIRFALKSKQVPFTTQVYRRGRLTTAVFRDGQPTMVADSFNGLPVAADTRGPTIAPVSQRVARKTTKDDDKGCGCSGDK